MLCRMVFCRIICKIVLRTFPVDVELFLPLSITNPVEAHIHCFGSALDYCVSEYANGTFVVELEWSGALGVANFGEGGSHGNGVFSVYESGSCFGFLYGGHDSVDDFAVDKNRSVEWRCWIIGSNGKSRFVG